MARLHWGWGARTFGLVALLGAILALAGGAPAEAVDEQPYVVREDWSGCTSQDFASGCEDGAVCWTWGTWTCDQGTIVVSTEAYPDDYCFIGLPEFDYCKQG